MDRLERGRVPPNILVVEDDPITRRMLRVSLELEGYEVAEASGGSAALEFAGARRPDLVILDEVFPDMDGLQLVAEIRRRAGAELPAIIVTGMASRLEELRSRSGDITHVLGKPVAPSQLLEVVRAQLAPATGGAGPRILVVDDEPMNLKLTAFRLTSAGYQVETASSGQEALALARRRRPDAILTDVMMPSMDGFTLCREARREPALGAIPIVLVSSAYVDEADRELARQMGANALVVRTPDVKDALAALGSSLRGSLAAPPPATGDDVTALHQQRLQVQLERQTARNEEVQQRLHQVVAHSPAVLYSLRPEGAHFVATWISENVERLLGYSPEEALAPDWWPSHIHPADVERVLAEMAEVSSTGSVAHQYRFRGKDGAYLWLRAEIRLLRDAAGAPVEVVGSWSDVTVRKEAESRLRESEEQYRLLFDASPFPLAVIDRDNLAFLAVNDAGVRSYGYSRDEFMAMTLRDIRTGGEDALLIADYRSAAVAWAVGDDEHPPRIRRHKKKDGTVIEVEINRSAILFQGRPAWLSLFADVTQKRSLEAQLVKAQKMEAVGQLAGGVAHDFNNLLGVITGYSELLMRELPEDSRERKRAEEIKRAADRAAALTRQLLAFSRRQVLQPKVLDLNETVAEVEKMMRRLISENIQIVTVASAGLGKIRADEGQLEQVLMNLAINARDAMPSGGRLVIETGNVELDETYRRTNPEAKPGSYVMLAVSDTGHGMDANTMSRIFEPFFTTKEEGKGTGLGLATVYGIVRQSGGTVNVYSEPGRGTSFKVYLPRVEAEEEASARKDPSPPPRGTETILVVEDAEALRVLVRELLENAGYEVLEAEAPDKALDLVESTAGEIHLVLTDMVMPRMSGQELVRRIAARRPRTRVVFMSGYSDQAVGDLGTLAPGTIFLQKPFTMDALMRTIRHALDSPPSPPEPSA